MREQKTKYKQKTPQNNVNKGKSPPLLTAEIMLRFYYNYCLNAADTNSDLTSDL